MNCRCAPAQALAAVAAAVVWEEGKRVRGGSKPDARVEWNLPRVFELSYI